MKAVLDGLKRLGPARIAALAVAGLGTLAMLALLMISGGSPRMALLYGDLDLRDSGQMVDQLSRAHIPYRLEAGGAQILVPAEQVPQARVLLAQQGLPSNGTVGYEIFDHQNVLGETEFQQRIDETRALEGELDRTIEAIRGVRAARVHLVLPQRALFARTQDTAQASVLLTMAGAARLDQEGVQAILNLVAAAVPGLRPQNIAIVDSRGDLLARAGEPVQPAATAMTQEETRHATELRLARAVEEMLERSLGPGHVRAEANVQMNFDQVNTTQETYDPNGQVPRSEQSVTDQSESTQPAATVSVQNNLPNAPSATQGPGTKDNRREETTNYEISKTVRTLIHQEPQITRISLAVMIDSAKAPAAADLQRITELVKTAIGYDQKRGDDVQVVAMPFAGDNEAPAPRQSFLAAFSKPELLHLAETGLFGLIGVLVLVTVLRPMVLRIAALPATGGAELTSLPRQGSAEAGVLAAPDPSVPLLEDDRMVNIAQIEGQLRASSMRKLVQLVERHPDETLAIVRNWMVQESG